MHDIDLIVTPTGSIIAALVCGYVTFRLELSPIVGYLVAGFVVGPNTPGFVADQYLADQFAEVGVILLMFGVGLQFHFQELLAVRRVALPGALGQSLVATLLGTLVGVAAGWGWSAVIELNVDTVREFASGGGRAVYGDATRHDTLEQAGLADAVALILSGSDMHGTGEAIRLARELNPRVLIVARSTSLREHRALREAGADVVFSGEGEVALAMTEFLLRQLGATPEQIDRERARIRSEFFGSSDGESLPGGRTLPVGRVEWPAPPGEGAKRG